jgi:putative transcriptional regulator
VSDFSTAPGALIAVPQLQDPNFHRSVVVMIQHDADGALGLVVNHPTHHGCRDVAAGFGLPWPGGDNGRLRRGGPVEPQSLWMLHDDGWGFDETMRVADGVSVSRSREALTRMCQGGEDHLRLLVGYAGWGPGQLEREIAAGSWIVAETTAALVFAWPADEVWSRALSQLGIDPAHLVESAGMVQ